jgi:tungstate transport system permease protein
LEGVVLGHAILVYPLYVSFAPTALENVDPRLKELVNMFGLGGHNLMKFYMREAATGFAAAAVAAYGRAIGELGVALMLGGDIRYRTRVLTTAIVHETMLGNWDTAALLGSILPSITVLTGVAVNLVGFKYRG